ncbi:MAG: hypothetical protein ABI960_04475 [Candidatus Eisenbacteria bacterium]
MFRARRRPVSRVAVRWTAGLAVGCALWALGATARPAAAAVAGEAPAEGWRGRTLAVMPLLQADSETPELVLAQRSITRDLGKRTDEVGPEPEFAYVDVPGWKSPGTASLLSMALPGAGQLYAGSKSGFVFLGVEAVAVLAYVKYRGDSHEKRDQYFGYVGDPNQPGSRFSFERLAGTVSTEELERLRKIYEKDPREFYDEVSTNDVYAGGWTDPNPDIGADGARSTAQAYLDEVESLGRKSRVGLFAAIANHVAGTVDALHLARMNNLALRENLSLKVKVRPGAHQSYGLTLTQKF